MKNKWLITSLLLVVFLAIVSFSFANPFSFSVKQSAGQSGEHKEANYLEEPHDHENMDEDEALEALEKVETYQYDSKQALEEFIQLTAQGNYQDALSKFSLDHYIAYVAENVEQEKMDYVNQLQRMSKGEQIESFIIGSKKKKNSQDVFPVTIFYQDNSEFSYEFRMTREIDDHTGKFYWVIDESISELLKHFP